MKLHVVTTTNAAGWKETGRRMAQSFLSQWAGDSKLTVYAEGFDPDIEGIEVRRLPAWLDEFKAKHKDNPAAHGLIGGRPYSYTHDCVKFAHKVAALTDFAEPISDGFVVWLDADTYTHAPVLPRWLELLFPEPAYIAWLDRYHSHPECGLVMFRAAHPYHANFMQAFRNLYTSGEVFRLRETHDSYVLQHLVTAKVADRKIPPPASLSGAAVRTSHPFVNGPLGIAMDHMKGPRKQMGKTPNRDIVLPRNEAYWKV